MTSQQPSRLAALLRAHHDPILADWIARQLEAGRTRYDEGDLRERSGTFLRLFAAAIDKGSTADVAGATWSPVRDMLGDLSRARAREGYTPTHTAAFVLSLKQAIFTRLREEIRDAQALGDEVWSVTEILDNLALYTTEVFQKGREEVIARQQQEMLELSTPVVELWDSILALPLIGTLDSERTQVVMESLLQRIVETSGSIAIIDITGVPTVDTLVAQHLLKTVAAARLMGADCIISGIRPQIAQTIVHLGVELGTVTTKATLADAFRVALQRRGLTVAKAGA
jgi:rsbT co-antagonist protein RsbR